MQYLLRRRLLRHLSWNRCPCILKRRPPRQLRRRRRNKSEPLVRRLVKNRPANSRVVLQDPVLSRRFTVLAVIGDYVPLEVIGKLRDLTFRKLQPTRRGTSPSDASL